MVRLVSLALVIFFGCVAVNTDGADVVCFDVGCGSASCVGGVI